VKCEHDNRVVLEANSKTAIRQISDIHVPTVPTKYENVFLERAVREITDISRNPARIEEYRKSMDQ